MSPRRTPDPTVTVEKASDQNNPTDTGSARFVASFSEAVTALTSGDIDVSGVNNYSITNLATSDGGTTWTFTVSGIAVGETATVAIPAGKTQTSEGIQNQASTSSDNQVTRNPPPLMCGEWVVTVDLRIGQTATEGDDVIRGTAENDVINGLGGNDIICGLQGDDVISGGDGFDVVAMVSIKYSLAVATTPSWVVSATTFSSEPDSNAKPEYSAGKHIGTRATDETGTAQPDTEPVHRDRVLWATAERRRG